MNAAGCAGSGLTITRCDNVAELPQALVVYTFTVPEVAVLLKLMEAVLFAVTMLAPKPE